MEPMDKLLYDFSVYDVNNKEVLLSQFKDKVVVIVNTASLCGFTPQYYELEQLYQRYKNDGLEIIAFPCNQFNEEPLPIQEVVKQIRKRFKVTFPIYNKVWVNGDKEPQLYSWLKQCKPGRLGFKGVFWNFEKFVIDRQGKVVVRYFSDVTPFQFEQALKYLLQK